MVEVLSQEAIDQLLASIKPYDTESEGFYPPVNTRKIKIYDFRRPDRFSRLQIKNIDTLHANLARAWTEYLGRTIMAPVHVHIFSVDQLTYEEFIRSLPTPTTCMAVSASLEGNTLPSRIIVEIGPAITEELLYRWFDGLYDGDHFLNNNEQRNFNLHELTGLEKAAMRYFGFSLLEKYSVLLIDCCGVSLQTRGFCVETNPRFLNVLSPWDDQMVVLIILEAKINDVEGMINIALPYQLVRPFENHFSYPCFGYAGNVKNTQVKKQISRTHIPGIQVRIRAELFRKIMKYEELAGMGFNSIIPAPNNYDKSSCFLMNGNMVLFRGEDITNYEKPQSTRRIKITEKIMPYKEFNIMDDKPNLMVERALGKMNVQVIVELGRTRKTQEELLQVREGTIMELDKLGGEPVDIFANNVLFAKGEVVVIDESFGVRITGILADNGNKNTGNENDLNL